MQFMPQKTQPTTNKKEGPKNYSKMLANNLASKMDGWKEAVCLR